MTKRSVLSAERIEGRIFLLRAEKVMLSTDLAELYNVEPRVLIQAVKRNRVRFPEDFMFQLRKEEFENLKSRIVILEGARNSSRSQNVILKRGQNVKYYPYAFTEQGAAMLSGVLRSRRAVQVNIAIMRAFVKLRGMVAAQKELASKLTELERKVTDHDGHIGALFETIRQLMAPPEGPVRRIGFRKGGGDEKNFLR